MLFTCDQTKEILTAETIEELSEALRPVWKSEDHYPCLFRELEKFTLEEKRKLFGKQMEIEEIEDGKMFTVEFHGDLTDEELDNVAGGDFCDDLINAGSGRGPFLKPVIYLYPEKETEVSVKVGNADLELTCTYPAYNDGWKVTAAPDGALSADGKTYRYLYWEGEGAANWDFTEGFCVAVKDTAAFLEDSLAKLGLNQKEANEFIVYWLPRMQENAYNLVSFQKENYDAAAPLTVEPAPDTLIRVFMVYKPLGEAVAVKPQELSAPERRGFTVVEWGGSYVNGDKAVFTIE